MCIKCLIVDDEPLAREVLKRYIEQMPALTLVGECGNAIQANTILQQQEIDLVFLDIRMPQLNGTDFYHRGLRETWIGCCYIAVN